MPHFEDYPDARLAEEVAQYGFKPMKRRGAMITVLKQCWTSQHVPAVGAAAGFSTSAVGAARAANTASTTTKRATIQDSDVESADSGDDSGSEAQTQTQTQTRAKKGRPKKNAKSDVETAKSKRRRPKKDAGSDSDTAKPKKGRPRKKAKSDTVTTTTSTKPKKSRAKKGAGSDSDAPKPKRGRARQKATPTEPAKPKRSRSRSRSSSPRMEVSILPADEPDAHECMTRAIKADPPSADPARPSWHERMLMYDVIVLEELAAWFNTGALAVAGWDGEVGTGDVKRWAEARGILVVAEETRGGRVRKG
jgi:hypothetical protein